MYRVLLVDDELHICQLVRYLVNWDDLGVQLIGTALSGEEAMKKVDELHPDIIITDIQMSGCSGLDLLDKVPEWGYPCRFILISGYCQFEYAQKAIRHGVVDYLVKPLKKNEIENALRKASAELDRENFQQSDIMESRALHPKEKLINDLQSDALSLTVATKKYLKEHYQVELSGNCFVLCWHFVCRSGYSGESLNMMIGKVSDWLQKRGTDWFREFFLLRKEEELYVICSVDSKKTMLGFQLIREECQAVLSVFHEWSVKLGTTQFDGEEGLDFAIKRASSVCMCYLFDPSKSVFIGEKFGELIDDYHVVINYEMCSRVASAIQILDIEAIKKEITDCMSIFSRNKQMSGYAVMGFTEWLLEEINRIFGALLGEENRRTGYVNQEQFMQEWLHIASMENLQDRLLTLIEEKVNSVSEQMRHAENRPVRVVKQIVAERYMEPVGLNEIAEVVKLNPVYLSMLFKRETGTNFKDYLTVVRMEHAKRLLRNGETLNVVADAVGYKDVKYFSKLFKRTIGVNPTQYRKLYH